MDNKYGVNSFVSEVHVKSVDFDETFKMPEYRYVVEIVTIESNKGNGLMEMKIYTEGKLQEFLIGNWKISPIVKMPFNWTGNSNIIDLQDNNANIISKRGIPDERSAYKKTDYILDIKWVFETIRNFEKIESAKHYQLIEYDIETKRLLNIYKEHTDIKNILSFNERINFEIETLSELKTELTDIGYQFSKIMLNETIDLVNDIKLKKID